MNRFDEESIPLIQPYLAAFHAWESQVRERYRIETEFAHKYMELLHQYQEKWKECEREKRNATVWEREQRFAERELNALKSIAVSTPAPLTAAGIT